VRAWCGHQPPPAKDASDATHSFLLAISAALAAGLVADAAQARNVGGPRGGTGSASVTRTANSVSGTATGTTARGGTGSANGSASYQARTGTTTAQGSATATTAGGKTVPGSGTAATARPPARAPPRAR
jgi:hypothetical protein